MYRASSAHRILLSTILYVTAGTSVYAVDTIHDRIEKLSSHTQLVLPKTGDKHPLAVLLPGCLSWHPHHDKWRNELLKQGFAVLHIDSFSARGYQERGVLESQVCTGRRIRGDERAGDLMATLSSVWDRPDIHPDRTILMGWSHGGWTAMDFMIFTETDSLPPNLSELPVLGVENFRAAFLFYPYCGFGSKTGAEGFPATVKTLIFHGTADIITNPTQCRSRVEALALGGADIEFISLRGARHWFDNHDEPLTFDSQTTSRVTGVIRDILQEMALVSGS